MVQRALQVAGDLEQEGISVEVVDPRTLVPLDEETILGSVARTSRLVIVHDAVKRHGFGAEVAALVTEKGFRPARRPDRARGRARRPHALQRQARVATIPSPESILAGIRSVLA